MKQVEGGRFKVKGLKELITGFEYVELISGDLKIDLHYVMCCCLYIADHKTQSKLHIGMWYKGVTQR